MNYCMSHNYRNGNKKTLYFHSLASTEIEHGLYFGSPATEYIQLLETKLFAVCLFIVRFTLASCYWDILLGTSVAFTVQLLIVISKARVNSYFHCLTKVPVCSSSIFAYSYRLFHCRGSDCWITEINKHSILARALISGDEAMRWSHCPPGFLSIKGYSGTMLLFLHEIGHLSSYHKLNKPMPYDHSITMLRQCTTSTHQDFLHENPK